MAQDCVTAAATEHTLYNNRDQKYFTNRKISGLCTKPKWQSSLAFEQRSLCKRWGQRAGTAGLPHSWEHSTTRAATSAANSGHHHCAATLSFPSKRRGIFTLEPNDGVSISHLARLLIFRMRQDPSFPRQFQREQPCPQFQGALHLLLHRSRVTFIANPLKKL